jgi:predicted RNA-binding protein with PUA-like domain
MQYWLVKQEPEDYAWSAFAKDGKAVWTGVRNFQARNNLRAMKKGDRVLYYHSGDSKEVVGIARVGKDLVPLVPLTSPVSLSTIKGDAVLKNLPMVKLSRLSVSPVTESQFKRLLELGATKAP